MQVGYEIIEATNGKKAINNVDKDVDLVILDLMTPEIDGLEVCKIIRRKKALKELVL